jgi:hypothetical protein
VFTVVLFSVLVVGIDHTVIVIKVHAVSSDPCAGSIVENRTIHLEASDLKILKD